MDKLIAEKIDNFFKKYKKQIFKSGEILIRADDNPHGIYYITEGIVKSYAISKKGDEVVVNIFKPVAFFPMSWAINETQNNYYYEAAGNVEVWRAPKEDVVEFIKNNPDVLYNLLSRVYKGTDGLLTRMVYLMSGNAYGRLITELIIHSRRFGEKDNNELTYKIKTSEKDIANQTGLTRETISREMKILKDKGIVTFKNNLLVIKNINQLEDELINS